MEPVDVLIIEDDDIVARTIERTLRGHEFRITVANSGVQGLQLARRQMPAVVVLDVIMPGMDGYSVCREMRADPLLANVPILFLTAKSKDEDKITGFRAGADDYLTKPFGTNELLARIRVALRHAHGNETDDPIIEIGPLHIDQARHEVTVDGELVHLTPIEFRLLALLARHAGKVITHRQLLLEVWGPNATHQTHYLRVHMAALRRKIEKDPARPRWLATEAGVGYRLRDGE